MSVISDYYIYNYFDNLLVNADPGETEVENIEKKNTSKNVAALASMFNRSMYDSIIDAGIAKLEETVGKFKQLFVEQTGMEDEEFFKLLNDVEKNALQESASEMTKNLQMPEDPTDALHGNLLKKDINSLQKLINSYKDIAATMLNLDSADILDTYFENELLSSTKYKTMIAGSANEAKARYRDMYIEKNMTIHATKKWEQQARTSIGYVKKILSNLSQLQQIMTYYKNNSMGRIQTDAESSLIQSLLWSTYNTFNKTIGLASEKELVDILNNYFSNLYPEMQAGHTGSEKGKIFNVKTQDIQIKLNLDEKIFTQSNVDLGNVSITLPGVSLKRIGDKKVKTTEDGLRIFRDIRIKGTSLDKLLANAVGLDETHIRYFLNAYANYRREIKLPKKMQARIPQNNQGKQAMTDMYNVIHASMLPVAIAGGFDADDFGYYFVVNGEVFSVIDILKSLLSDNSVQGSAITSSIEQSQYGLKQYHTNITQPNENGDDPIVLNRSDAVRDAIYNQKVEMELTLAFLAAAQRTIKQ